MTCSLPVNSITSVIALPEVDGPDVADAVVFGAEWSLLVPTDLALAAEMAEFQAEMARFNAIIDEGLAINRRPTEPVCDGSGYIRLTGRIYTCHCPSCDRNSSADPDNPWSWIMDDGREDI